MWSVPWASLSGLLNIGDPLALLRGVKHRSREVVAIGVYPDGAIEVFANQVCVIVADELVVLVDNEDVPRRCYRRGSVRSRVAAARSRPPALFSRPRRGKGRVRALPRQRAAARALSPPPRRGTVLCWCRSVCLRRPQAAAGWDKEGYNRTVGPTPSTLWLGPPRKGRVVVCGVPDSGVVRGQLVLADGDAVCVGVAGRHRVGGDYRSWRSGRPPFLPRLPRPLELERAGHVLLNVTVTSTLSPGA